MKDFVHTISCNKDIQSKFRIKKKYYQSCTVAFDSKQINNAINAREVNKIVISQNRNIQSCPTEI